MNVCDTMPNECLLYKISRYGGKDKPHDWIRSFLSNTSQCVMINRCRSDSVPVSHGIPQLSVPGHLLVVIYINDVIDSVRSNVYLVLYILSC